jgi:hypothetical protein
VVFGGSDGHECFSDVHILDLVGRVWSTISPGERIPRLSHTSTLVGSFLFIFGGHDGSKYVPFRTNCEDTLIKSRCLI